jgi:hypothetical protein
VRTGGGRRSTSAPVALALAVTLVALLLGGGCRRADRDRGRDEAEAPSGPSRGGVTRAVSPDGDDDGAGDDAAPWRTLRHALASLAAGDTLVVHGGRYTEDVRGVHLRPGRRDARITVTAAPGEHPELHGLLWLDRPSYWTIRGLRVTWGDGDSDEHLVKLTDGIGWTFEANEVWGARSFAGVLVAGTRKGEPGAWRLVGNCIHDTIPSNETNQDHLVYVNTGLDAGGGAIEGNLLFGARNGAGIKLGGPSADEGGAVATHIAFNTIADTAQAVVVAWRSRDNSIDRNLLGPVGRGYGAIRAFELTGKGNRATENVAFGARRLVLDDRGGASIETARNRFPVNPQYVQERTCDGYVPSSPEVDAVGHTAASLPPEAQRR